MIEPTEHPWPRHAVSFDTAWNHVRHSVILLRVYFLSGMIQFPGRMDGEEKDVGAIA